MDEKAGKIASFTRAGLPWLLGACAVALYLLTLNGWVTLDSVAVTARVLGWDWWSPKVERPLFHLLTWPVRWITPGAQVGALNAFSAICAGLAVAQLARSVALLPHDRTREQRLREVGTGGLLSTSICWIPPFVS